MVLRPRFDPRPVQGWFVEDRVELEQFLFTDYYRFPLSLAFLQCSILVHVMHHRRCNPSSWSLLSLRVIGLLSPVLKYLVGTLGPKANILQYEPTKCIFSKLIFWILNFWVPPHTLLPTTLLILMHVKLNIPYLYTGCPRRNVPDFGGCSLG